MRPPCLGRWAERRAVGAGPSGTVRAVAPGVTASVLVVVLGGCSGQGSVQAGSAAETARAFARAVGADVRSACALLAPGTRETLEHDAGPCVTALPRVGLSDPGGVRDVEIYGLDAWVRLEHDTVFLARFDGGWRVTAAGCVPQGPGEPYSCEIERG